MMLDVTLPELPGGAAQVLRWLAEPGAALAAGDPLLIVRTEAAEIALPATCAGELAELLIAVGQVADAGQALARVRPAGQAERPAPKRATPLARRIAEAYGIDLSSLAGSGVDGRVVAEDVRRQAAGGRRQEAAGRLPPAACRLPPIASAMVEFDAGAALALCAAQGASLAACVAEAAAGLLPTHRALNASWTEDGILLRRRVHLAVASPAGGRLAWALLRDAGDLTLRGVVRAMAAEASDGDLAEATLALVSQGAAAIWQSAPPLAGTAAALGLGAPDRRPVVCGAAIAIRPLAALTLSYDARALDHAQAAAFLHALKDRLERI